MKKLLLIVSCAMLLLALPITAYASEIDGDGVKITVVIPQTAKPTPTPTPAPPKNHLYPVSVWESQENGRHEIIRTYELGAGEKPEDISRESFTREGWLYELADITKKETANADVRDHTETVSIDTNTKEMDAIIKLLAPTMEFQSDDGYIGVLQLDISSIKVETAGTKSSSYTVSATREYPHLSSNDTSLVPKTITDGGRTLTLANIDWKAQNTSTVDYDQIADSYTAVAKYTATASKTTVTGYTTTAEYHGVVSKILTGRTVYTAYFIGVPIVTGTVNKPANTVNETTTGTTETQAEEPASEQSAEPTITESEVSAETETPTETIPPTETAPPSDKEAEPKENSFNFLVSLFTVLIGAGIGGGFVFFYLNKIKKERLSDEKLPLEETENEDIV